MLKPINGNIVLRYPGRQIGARADNGFYAAEVADIPTGDSYSFAEGSIVLVRGKPPVLAPTCTLVHNSDIVGVYSEVAEDNPNA